MRRQFHRDGYRTMLLSTVSRLAYPLGWGMEEAFREAGEGCRKRCFVLTCLMAS